MATKTKTVKGNGSTPANRIKALVKPTGKKQQSGGLIVIPAPDYRGVILNVIGLSSYIGHAWSEKSRKMMADKQGGAPKTRKREARNPEEEFHAARYFFPDEGDKKPSDHITTSAFRKAAIAACRTIDGITMTMAMQLFYCPAEFVKIIGPAPVMRTDTVRLDSGVASLAYRPEYWPWECRLQIDYNAGATSAEQIVNLFVLAGRSVGVGEMRIAKGFNHGAYTVG